MTISNGDKGNIFVKIIATDITDQGIIKYNFAAGIMNYREHLIHPLFNSQIRDTVTIIVINPMSLTDLSIAFGI